MSIPKDWPETLIATHSGLRGRPGIDLTPAVVRRVIRSFVTLLLDRGVPASVALARDGRSQGEELAAGVAGLVREAGFDVLELGEVSTPTAKLAARSQGTGGAIVVTASHLGHDWNGLKLVAGPDYLPVDVRELLVLPEAPQAPQDGRVLPFPGALDLHVDAISAAVDVETIRSAGLRVSVTGGVGPLGRILLERLGCRTGGGRIDVGLVLDADGDRLQFVDEQGERLDPEVVLPLVAEALGAVRVVKGADTSRMVDEVVRRAGGAVTVVSPGELHLVEELIRIGADLAGEGNGGVVVPAIGRTRDALAAAALVLEHVARTGSPLSGLVGALPRFVRRRWTVSCAGPERAQAILGDLAARLGVADPDDPEVGITVGTAEAWALVRRSATEHVLRVTVESRDDAAADSLQRELDAVLGLQLQPA